MAGRVILAANEKATALMHRGVFYGQRFSHAMDMVAEAEGDMRYLSAMRVLRAQYEMICSVIRDMETFLASNTGRICDPDFRVMVADSLRNLRGLASTMLH